MKIIGIICEYDPFHRGHAAQIAAIRRQYGADAAVVCVMSGSFVQRGEPALFDKYRRSAAAVACGADLVLELPVSRVLSSAEGFAAGGVEVLDRLGCVDHLCFGCECGSGDLLWAAANAMQAPDFDEALRRRLAEGIAYAAAKQQVLEARLGQKDILRRPNDILGAEYCRALLKRHSAITPFAIPRPGDYHGGADPENPSAEHIRSQYPAPGWDAAIPSASAELLHAATPHRMQWGDRAILARLRAMTEPEWAAAAHGSEGLWRKVAAAARTCPTTEAVLQAAKSKRYPMTRLRRLVLCAYLGISAEALTAPMEEVQVLAFSEAGRAVLKQCREKGSLPLRNPGERCPAQEESDRIEGLYALFVPPESEPLNALENVFFGKMKKKLAK